ncbi:CY250 protein, partial [Tyrannus savana]|nr:CY250 protein [Tyrannus savana]
CCSKEAFQLFLSICYMAMFSLAFLQLSEEYGPVFTVHLGSYPVVVLHGHSAVKEALIDRADEFAARGRMPIGDRANNGLGMFAG